MRKRRRWNIDDNGGTNDEEQCFTEEVMNFSLSPKDDLPTSAENDDDDMMMMMMMNIFFSPSESKRSPLFQVMVNDNDTLYILHLETKRERRKKKNHPDFGTQTIQGDGHR